MPIYEGDSSSFEKYIYLIMRGILLSADVLDWYCFDKITGVGHIYD